MEKELRRRQSILSVTGNGVLFLGMWSFLKVNLYFILGRSSLLRALADETMDEGTMLLISYIVSMIFVSVELFLRIRIRRSAIAESMGQKQKTGYIRLTIFLIILYSSSIIYSVFSLKINSANVWDQLASLMVDITSLVMMVELVSAARFIQRYQDYST